MALEGIPAPRPCREELEWEMQRHRRSALAVSLPLSPPCLGSSAGRTAFVRFLLPEPRFPMPFVLAAGAMPDFLPELVALVVIAAAVAYVSKRLGLVPIVGFLAAGVLIGPNQLGLVQDQALVDAAAEVGVLLLLFTIGIEFSLEKLARIQRLIIGGGGLQVIGTTGAVVAILMVAGVAWQAAVFTGFLVALSSTAIVLKLLGDRGETSSERGQAAVGLLIFQDIAIIVMVLLIPMLGGAGGGALGIAWALGKAALVIAAVLVVARKLMPPVLEAIAKTCSNEVFLIALVAICFGTAYLVGLAGISIALGAFLAGLVVSESKFSEHAFGEILPLQILFSATFFVSVGMLLDVGFLLSHLPLVLGVVAVVLVLKAAVATLSVRALGYPLATAGATGLLIAQVGEFSFVLERAGREFGLTPGGAGADGTQTFIAATVLLMAATPAMAALAGRFGSKLARRAEPALPPEPAPDDHAFDGLRDHVIVAGYGPSARKLVRVLRGSGIPYVVATLSPEGAREAEAESVPVHRGDYARQRTLDHLGLDRAKLLVLADDAVPMAHRVISVATAFSPTTRVVALTRTLADAEALQHAGADRVISSELEAVVGLFDDVLRQYGLPAEEVLVHEEAVRLGNYEAFGERPADAKPVVECALDAHCLSTRTVTIRAGAPIAARSLGDLHLRRDYGLYAEAVVQNGREQPHPDRDLVLNPGDSVRLVGTIEAFQSAADLFRAASAAGDGSAALPPPRPRVAAYPDPEAAVTLEPRENTGCTHTDQIRAVHPSANGCEECLRIGSRWVHLRTCMSCGHVGCCDSSLHQHASKHHAQTGHPIVRSAEPGETWGWCYEDEVTL